MSSSEEPQKNSYLDQVVAQQAKLEVDLKKRAVASPVAAMVHRQRMAIAEPRPEAVQNAVEVRITGFWRWKTVVVPPNAFVVHTRRGRSEPLHLGLGVSFPFNPAIDSFLVVPGAMQTILINAHCICRERQGLLVQAYVQWIIQDFGTAYKKLEFSDGEDPMRSVNLQLREQAEAAIKDKVATMSIDDVLSDKQPIIEELTARLRHVAEGEGTDKGLGLRIVTVQIKEAVVSSSRLWESLQKPFRADRARIARLAELDAEEIIASRESETLKTRTTVQLETDRQLAQLRASAEAETFDRQQAESIRRARQQQENARALAVLKNQQALQQAELDKKQLASDGELARLKLKEEEAQRRLALDEELATARARAEGETARAKLELEIAAARQAIENQVSGTGLQARLVESLPALMEKLPHPKELKSISIGGGGGELQAVASTVAQVMAVLEALRTPPRPGAS